MRSIRATDQVFIASQFVDSFRHLTEKAKAKQKLPGAKEKFEILKQLDDDTGAALLLAAESELKKQMKRKTKKAVGQKLEELSRKL